MTDNSFSANKRMVINQIARHHLFGCAARGRWVERTGICGTNFCFPPFTLCLSMEFLCTVWYHLSRFFFHVSKFRNWEFLSLLVTLALPRQICVTENNTVKRRKIIFSEAAIANNAFWGMNELYSSSYSMNSRSALGKMAGCRAQVQRMHDTGICICDLVHNLLRAKKKKIEFE